MPARGHIELCLGSRCHVCPVYPRRDTNHPAQLEHTIGCAARLCAEDDESTLHAFHRVVNDLHTKGFPLANDIAHVNLAVGNELVYVARLPDGTHDDGAGGDPNGEGVPAFAQSTGDGVLMEFGESTGPVEEPMLPLYEILDEMQGWQ